MDGSWAMLAELILALCLWPFHEEWAKCSPPKLCLPSFSIYDGKIYTSLFLGRNESVACIFIMLLSQIFLSFPLPYLLGCIECEEILHIELLQQRVVGQEWKEVLRYSIIYSPILCTSLKNPCRFNNYNQRGQTDTISKASINECSSYTILSQETSRVRKKI